LNYAIAVWVCQGDLRNIFFRSIGYVFHGF